MQITIWQWNWYRSLYFRPDWIASKPEADAQERIDNVLKSLLKQEQKAIVSPNVLVAVGYGACLDIFVNAADLLGEEKQPNEPNHADEIKTKKDLLETFAYFFSHGAAAEYDS